MIAFAESAAAWLNEDPANVIALHCKAGKGRAGLMACVALLRMGIADSALNAIIIYDKQRMKDHKDGLTQVSQRKYVTFYEMLLKKYQSSRSESGISPAVISPEEPTLRLIGIDILNLPTELEAVSYKIIVEKTSSSFHNDCLLNTAGKILSHKFSEDCDVSIQGNFQISLARKSSLFSRLKKVIILQHNTFFIPR